MEKLNIKVSLANRLYPMNVSPSEEKFVRISASKIEKIIKEFREKYSVRDDQDLLAMCALQLCVKLEKSSFNKAGLEQKILDDILDIKQSIAQIS